MSKKSTRTGIFIALLVVVLIIIFVPRWLNPSPGESAPAAPKANTGNRSGGALPVNVYIAAPSDLINGIRAVGSLVANEEVELTSETAGKVVKISFHEGSRVKKGDLLAKINADDIVAQLERAEEQLKLLGEQLERQRILLAKDAVSRESFDKVQTDYNMTAADISLYKARIEKTEIRAAFDGVVGFRYVSEGGFVQPGTKVARMVDNSSLKIEFSIPEKYISLQLMGRDVAFQVEGFSQVFRAKVYAIDPMVEHKTRTIALRAIYDNSNEQLLPGMSATITLITFQSARAIQVPAEAIVSEMDGRSVWVVRNGKAVSTKIATGIRSESTVEIISGLIAGDSIITTGLMQLRPNMPVNAQVVE
ncbi:MAG: efflux RND transporter periplasmic adaptor subunit [Bacteroidales bacterium]|nr:efflux RND transporter periplasmic adaptor subunit [Bacteroidales bacterium]MCL2133161.1 efflux RND transporter periplasmic adaptor subunit [Bacteroidales bacterium]